MEYFIYTLISIAVYLITFAVMWHVFQKREADLETEYRLNYARICTTFIETMQTVSKALDTDTDMESEQTTLHELAVSLCRSSHCHYFDGFGCTRSDVITDSEETCPCDIEMRRATDL